MPLVDVSTTTAYGQINDAASTDTLTVTKHGDGSYSFIDVVSGQRIEARSNPAFERLLASIDALV